jgi:hypothetical protein
VQGETFAVVSALMHDLPGPLAQRHLALHDAMMHIPIAAKAEFWLG